MKILYIAYSCDPFNGSEDQIGWNVPLSSFYNGNEVYVLTKMEHKTVITNYLQDNQDIKIHYYFVDIPLIYKKIFKGLFYSARIIVWQKRALKIAQDICEKENIQIIHQVAPVEYRAIGWYGKIQKTKFVVGPIGGGFSIPKEMQTYVKNHFISEGIRKIANFLSFLALRVNKKIKTCDYIFFTNIETYKVFLNYGLLKHSKNYGYMCDVGTSFVASSRQYESKSKKTLLVPGRLYYRKGHMLLFDAIKKASQSNFIIRIVGDGPQNKTLKKIVEKDQILKKRIHFVGNIEYKKMNKEYMSCDAVILPSLSEATGTVLMEALSFGKPIITSDHFGAHLFKEYDCGWFFYGNSKDELVSNFAYCLDECCLGIDLENKCLNALKCAEKYTWKNKMSHFSIIYKQLLES